MADFKKFDEIRVNLVKNFKKLDIKKKQEKFWENFANFWKNFNLPVL